MPGPLIPPLALYFLAGVLGIYVACGAQYTFYGILANKKDRAKRIRARFWHFVLLTLDRAWGGTQKFLLSEIGSAASSIVIALWLVLEVFHWQEAAQAVPWLGPTVSVLVGLVAYVHLAKLLLDEAAKNHYHALTKVRGALAVQMSNLPDFFLRRLKQGATGYSPAAIADKASAMLLPMSRKSERLYVMAFRLKLEDTGNHITYVHKAWNKDAQTLAQNGTIGKIAKAFSLYELKSQTQEHPSFCLVDEATDGTVDLPFLDGCVVIENLGVERHVSAGRPLIGFDEGSYVAYTLGMRDASEAYSVGYMIVVASKKRGAFRGRHASDYCVPLRSCAMFLVGLDDDIPNNFPQAG